MPHACKARSRPDGATLMSGVQSVERAFAVLRCLSGGPAGVTDVADRVSLPKGTVSLLLSTLEELGMVEQIEPGGYYRVGGGMTEIAAKGWAWAFEEFLDGLNSVAAPIRDRKGRVVAAIHAHGPAYRFPGDTDADDVGRLVAATAGRVQL